MLDDVTKKRINTLRQILVGKLPDPKAQVEQITNGLIYKFMNDMDEQSVSMGGKSTYFSGKFQKYSWKNLMDTKTSGVEKIKLYSEAIEQMYTNENLPELFREIFKNSFLPFKDPSTLNMFLKEINEFNYSNSEKLGDAFEYLLSFMGSQGDAGQFRTPRHIIDFIVEIVNPQKNESILDPACGTAGFLISSYKHILNQNTKKSLGDELTASDRKKIGENLNGYDISPDMVKMSLVNMYLHKFTNPKINEYDTLSSEDRWNEYYDVILANPPFFSPKGGITPHNRFGVISSKAEVLFIDYINEHLKPKGRAGIIVPEGVIFQNGIAYKQLRKKLLETSLVAIISLPGGIFNPYSGVQTSILILDKEKSKNSKNIIFAKVHNDGFDLGANRKEINENDLPIIIEELKKNKPDNNFLIKEIEKKKIDTENYSFNLNDYIEDDNDKSSHDLININELVEFRKGESITKNTAETGNIPVIAGGKKISYYHSKSNREGFTITISSSGDAGYINCHNGPIFVSDAFTLKSTSKKLDDRFLYYLLKYKQKSIYEMQKGVAQKHVYPRDFKNFKIPVPNIVLQNQIIKELDEYQNIINGCNQVIQNYKPAIDINPNWDIVQLGDVCNVIGGGTPSKSNKEYWSSGNIKWLSCKHLDDNGSINGHDFITDKGLKFSSSKLINSGSVILVNRVSLGKVVYTYDDYAINQDLTGINSIDNNKIDNYFIFLFLSKIKQKFINDGRGVGVKGITRDYIKKIKLPIPPIKIQKEIIEEVKKDLNLINENKLMIARIEERMNKRLNLIWNN